jgi:hypothetical protein
MSAEVFKLRPFRLQWLGSILGCAIATTFFVAIARRNDVGLRFSDLFTLPPLGATLLYWTLAVVFAGWGLYALVCSVLMLWHGHSITVTDDAVTVPVSVLTRQTVTFPFVLITSMTVAQARKPEDHVEEYLELHVSGFGNYRIAKFWLSDWKYQMLTLVLSQRIKGEL